MKSAEFRAIEALADLGFRQNNGLACYDCGESLSGLRIVGRAYLCLECGVDRIAKEERQRKDLEVGPAA